MEFDDIVSDSDVSETSSISSISQSDYEELTTTEVKKIVIEQALSSLKRVAYAIQNEKSPVSDEYAIFGEYVASECREMRDKQTFLLLQKRIKDVIFKTKKSLFGSDSEEEIIATVENDVDRVQAVTRKNTNCIAEDLYDENIVLKNEENSNEDKEVSLMLNYSNKENTAKVKSARTSDTALINFESNEMCIKEENIDKYCDEHEVTETSHLSVVRLCEGKELNCYGKSRQNTSEKDIVICPPNSIADQSYKVGNRNQCDNTELIIDKEVANEYKLYKCPDCIKTFLTETHFHTHQELHATGIIKHSYDCKQCGKSFTDKRYFYNKHLKVHMGIKNHMCEICGKCFTLRPQLRQHMLIHGNIKKYKCTICENSFTQRNHLAVHLRVHRNDRRYKCTLCARSFIAKANLQQHMLVHGNCKNYCCKHCGKYFKHKNAFKMHLLWHSGVKEFICDMCGKGCYTQGKLNVHKKTHKVGMYICLECGKNFKYKDIIQRHMLIHIGEKNFMCDKCGKCFIHASWLRQHTKSHIHK